MLLLGVCVVVLLLCVEICVVLPAMDLLDVVPKVVVLSGKTTGLTVVVLSAVVVLGWGSV